MKAIMLSCFVLACCGPSPDFVTKNGVSFYMNGSTYISQNDAEVQEDMLMDLIDRVKGYEDKSKAEEMMKHIDVTIVRSKTFICKTKDGEDQTCTGTSGDGVIRLSEWGDCGMASEYTHELAHAYQQFFKDYWDYGHDETDLWKLVNELRYKYLHCQ